MRSNLQGEFDSIGGGFLSTALCDGLSARRSDADQDGDGAVSVQDMENWLRSRAIAHNRTSGPDDRVPLPLKVGIGHGITYLSRPLGEWPHYELMLPDGIPEIVLPIAPFKGNEAYIIGKTPVTNEALARSYRGLQGLQARRFNGKLWDKETFTVSEDPEFGDPQKPAVGITLRDALNHCQWLAERTRRLIHIVAPPTPDIWEAALFGDVRPRRKEEWFEAQPEIHSRSMATALCVNTNQRANKFGIIDLVGNVWEWCVNDYEWRWFTQGVSSLFKGNQQIYRPDPYPGPFISISSAPVVDYTSRPRCWLKGGGFYDDLNGDFDLTVESDIIADGMDSRHADVGFRVVGDGPDGTPSSVRSVRHYK